VRLIEIRDGVAVVALGRLECSLLSDGVRDDSSSDDLSISGELAAVFAALAILLDAPRPTE
jgi:hypothetical protein